MRLEEFRSLNQVDQYIILWEKSILIGQRENATYKYVLYQLDSFYIEFRLTKSNLKEVIRTFTRDRRLEPYLHDINLNELRGMMSL